MCKTANEIVANTSKGIEPAVLAGIKVNNAVRRRPTGFAPLSEIVDAAEAISGYTICTNYVSFAKEFGKDVFGLNVSAASLIKESKMILLVNTDNASAIQQRFATVHEIGHLLVRIPNYEYFSGPNALTLSTGVCSDVTSSLFERRTVDNFVRSEYLCNIFAVLVLLPLPSLSIQELVTYGAEHFAKQYGVDVTCIYSKFVLRGILD